jgi:hypothetical protein
MAPPLAWVKLFELVTGTVARRSNKKEETYMKSYLSFAVVIATSLGIANLAMARGGGGGGAHFGGGGMHSGSVGHFGSFAHTGRMGRSSGSAFREDRGLLERLRDGHRREFWGGGTPYYYGDWGNGGVNYSTTPGVSDDSAVAAGDFAAEDERVRSVQKALTRAGYYRYAIDGFWGLTTQDAVEQYEKANNLPVTGTIDGTLLRSLGLE